jgi:hypothetical protein
MTTLSIKKTTTPKNSGKLAKLLVFLTLGTFAVSYIFLSFGASFDAVKSLRIEKQLASLNSTITDLESTYFTLENSLTIDIAYAQGFTDAPQTKYAERTTKTKLSLGNGNGI